MRFWHKSKKQETSTKKRVTVRQFFHNKKVKTLKQNMVSKFIFAALFLCDVIFGSGNGDSKEVYKLHIKQFEEAVKDDKNVKPYIIDLFQYHVPNADAFSHQRNHAETKEFMECFGGIYIMIYH